MPTPLTIIALAAFPVLVIIAALRDATSMTIPNWISLALVAAFAPAVLATGLPLQTAAICVGVGVAMLAVGVLLFALRWIGGGDAKLMAAASVWLGVTGVAPFLIWTTLAGGVLCLVLLGLRRIVGPQGSQAMRPAWLGRLLQPKGDIPYGIAIAVGALLAFAHSPLAQASIIQTR